MCLDELMWDRTSLRQLVWEPYPYSTPAPYRVAHIGESLRVFHNTELDLYYIRAPEGVWYRLDAITAQAVLFEISKRTLKCA